MLTKLSTKNQLFLLILTGLVVRLIALPFVHTTNADAVSRTFIAYEWLQHPYLFTSEVWLPLHHYINALVIWIAGGEYVYSLKILHIVFAVATVIPLYKFTLNEFKTKEGAFFVSLTYLFIPIVLRNSFQVLSGIPTAFFIALAMYFLSQGKKTDQQVRFGMLAGLSMTMAGGIRYEAWLLIAVFTLILLLQKQWKMMLFFWVFAMIFPSFWMIAAFVEHGDFFYGSHGAYRWNIAKMGGNDMISSDILRWRLLYFPLIYGYLITPVIAGATLFYLVKSVKKRKLALSTAWWLLPFFILMGVFMYKAFDGTLLLQPRFALSIIITSLPFYALVFLDAHYAKAKTITALTIVVLLIPWSYLGIRNTAAFPRINDHTMLDLIDEIHDETDKNGAQPLILDFVGWDNTYFIRLRSGITPDNLYVVSGAKYGKVDTQQLAKKITANKQGIIVKNKKSKLDEHFHFVNDSVLEVREVPNYLMLQAVTINHRVILYKYKTGDKVVLPYFSGSKLLTE